MQHVMAAVLIALAGASSHPQVGWQFTFDSADFGGGKYDPVLENGTARYVVEHGYIGSLRHEFPPLALAGHPFFAMRARDVKGALFVKFKVDGQWQKHWSIEGWHPAQFETRFVDLGKSGAQTVSGVWLNSRSSTDGAEWFLDWLGFVKKPNPLEVNIVTAGGLTGETGRRALRFRMRNGLGADARLLCTVRALAPGDTLVSRRPLNMNADQACTVDLEAPRRPGTPYELTVADRDSRYICYQAPLVVPPVLAARLSVPNYRNALYATQAVERLQVDCTLSVLPPMDEGLALRTRLMHGDKLLREEEIAARGLEARAGVPSAGLSAGSYRIEVALERQGRLLARQRLPLAVYARHANEVRIDRDLNTRVNGQPFLPVGFYSVPREHLETVAKAGFTAVLTYDAGTERLRAYLDEAQRVGLKAVVHSPALWFGKDGEARLREAVSALRDRPSLLGWYLIDEPSSDRPRQSPAELARLDRLMQELDPYHPAFTVYCQPAEFAAYRDTHDVFLCDPYPVGNRPLALVAEWTELGKEAMGGRKPVHVVPQAFGSEKGPQTWWRMPTAEEEICMGYLALVHGAKGLFYYRFDVQQHDPRLAAAGKWPWTTIGHLPQLRPDAWAGLEKLGRQLKQLAPVILAPEPAAALSVSPGRAGLHVALRAYQGSRYLIAVNPTEETVEARITVEGLGTRRAEVLFEGRQLTARGGAVEDRFESLAVHVYRIP